MCGVDPLHPPLPAGPAYRARAQTLAFVAALKAHDYAAAASLLASCATLDLERYVDTPGLLTPLLWTCEAANIRPRIAAWSDAVKMILALIVRGADVAVRDKDGHGPLFHASLCDSDIITSLLDKGAKEPGALVKLADVCNGTSGGPAHGHEAILTRCIAEWDLSGLSASTLSSVLVLCCRSGYDAPAAALIAKGVSWKVDAAATPLLHWAAASGCVAAATALLDKGADVNAVNSVDQSALHLACVRRNAAVALLLVQRGAAHDCRDAVFRLTPKQLCHDLSGDEFEGMKEVVEAMESD